MVIMCLPCPPVQTGKIAGWKEGERKIKIGELEGKKKSHTQVLERPLNPTENGSGLRALSITGRPKDWQQTVGTPSTTDGKSDLTMKNIFKHVGIIPLQLDGMELAKKQNETKREM